MLKNKIITHSLCTLLFAAAPFAVAVPHVHAWDVIEIDSETHTGNTNPIDGIYGDSGAWKWREWPDCSNGGYRFLTVELDPLRHGVAYFRVQIPKTGFYKLETSYFDTENRTYDADYAVYVNATPTEAEAKTATPIYEVSINQTGPVEIPWRNLGTYCLKENDISMIFLDNNDDSQSASTDASRWTYVGDEYNSQRCGGAVNMTPINHLILSKPKI